MTHYGDVVVRAGNYQITLLSSAVRLTSPLELLAKQLDAEEPKTEPITILKWPRDLTCEEAK